MFVVTQSTRRLIEIANCDIICDKRYSSKESFFMELSQEIIDITNAIKNEVPVERIYLIKYITNPKEQAVVRKYKQKQIS